MTSMCTCIKKENLLKFAILFHIKILQKFFKFCFDYCCKSRNKTLLI